MKRIQIILLIIIVLPSMMMAQLNDDFNDGDFTVNPSWSGDVSQFKVNNSAQLQLDSDGENSSYLSTAISWFEPIEWSFWVKLSFSPSDNNYVKIYLLSDQQDLKGSLNGYYIRIGESGSDDAVELFRQTGLTAVSLCRGTAGALSSAFEVRIKVIRNQAGIWTVAMDTGGGHEFLPEATAADDTYHTGGWMGVVCKYTSSNSTKFYFDDFYGGPQILDIQKPQLNSVTLMTQQMPQLLELRFSEEVSLASSEQLQNYFVDHEICFPNKAIRDDSDHTVVTLEFPGDFLSDVTYTISVGGISDLAGNLIDPVVESFSWHRAKCFDLLITEIMCDPDPPVKLNGVEYLEIFNNTTSDIDLEGWLLSIGESVKVLPGFLLEAGGYVILAHDLAAPLLNKFGDVLTFPGFQLSNSGTTLIIRNPQGGLIHSIRYSPEWYRDDYKANGGWSLEMIDPGNPCGEAGNWTASIDDSGGTPGRSNSVKSDNPDLIKPEIIASGVPDLFHVELLFSELMDTAALVNPKNYLADNQLGNPQTATLIPGNSRMVSLGFDAAFNKGNIYHIIFPGILADCSGNPLNTDSIRFAVPDDIKAGDIVINEILFDPPEDGTDFLELFNRSLSVLDLSELTLSEYDTVTETLVSTAGISMNARLFFPGDYVVCTADTSAIIHRYSRSDARKIIRVPDMPPMPNDGGCIALARKSGTIVDVVSYSAGMHYPLLINTEGVSLERINPDQSSTDFSNWHSAAESAGYATPTCRNSQFMLPKQAQQEEISITPEIFSPDNDGYNDSMVIAYHFTEPDWNATVTIFDAAGYTVRKLVNNELCGTSGSWIWDGINDRRTKAPIGRYIICIEMFDLNGKLKKIVRTAVLAGKL